MNKNTAFDAVRRNDLKRLEQIIDNNPSAITKFVNGAGASLLQIAVKENKMEVVKILITRGANVNHKDYRGRSVFALCHNLQPWCNRIFN